MSESISCHHEKDGTLVVTVPKGTNVGRVLVQEEGTCIGSLYYSDHFADANKMMDELTLTLSSPITDEQFDAIMDVDFDRTSEITFHTKHGKTVRFVKETRGKWTEREVSDSQAIAEWQSARCSVCGKYHTTPYMYYFDEYKYCPNCGADMREP